MIGIFVTGFILGTMIGGGVVCWLTDYLDQKRSMNNRLHEVEDEVKSLKQGRDTF